MNLARRFMLFVVVSIITGTSIPANSALPVQEVGPGLFVYFGSHEELTPTNRGAVANIGFIVGERCVAVVDSGGSYSVGADLRNAVRNITPLPVCYVINTHVHPDHVFGNAAFRSDHPQFIGHVRLTAAMAARGPIYLRTLVRELGDTAIGSEIVLPTQTVADRIEIDLGGRVLELRAWKTAHTDNDLTVFDRKTGTLWLADLLFIERTPVLDGSLRGWLDVIGELLNFPAQQVVPGHGPVTSSWRQALDKQRNYLAKLADEVRQAIKAGRTIGQTIDSVALSEQEKWVLFDHYNRRNAAAAFAELEWE